MEATLQEILDARENRAQRRSQLLAQYKKPVICFTMNIAGPEKYSPLIARGFALGCEALVAQLEGIPILHEERLPRITGCEAFFVADAPAEQLKALTVQLEDATPLGRLFDMDVTDETGHTLTRQSERPCLLCSNSARICGRSRTHSVQQLQERTKAILRDAVRDALARRISAVASQALLWEVCTTPKPGLVDRENSGSHCDMDIFTFMSSTAALQHYFADCAKAGFDLPDPAICFARLRFLGKQALPQMLHATGGVNTHKGAIFTMGLLCAAAARLEDAGAASAESVLEEVKQLCKGLCAHDFAGITEENAVTVGQRLYAQFGITGVRGQAEQGYTAVLYTGLPVLEEGLALGYSLERAGCAALLAMLTATADTNMIARSDRTTAQKYTREVALLLARDRYPDSDKLRTLDSLFTAAGLSPGGSADLLAATYFLHLLCK